MAIKSSKDCCLKQLLQTWMVQHFSGKWDVLYSLEDGLVGDCAQTSLSVRLVIVIRKIRFDCFAALARTLNQKL